jgi:hypothetical protein
MSNAACPFVLKIGPGDIVATRFAPSAEEATPLQYSLGALFDFHSPPKFVDVRIGPPYATTASLAPSAEAAIELHACPVMATGVQLAPALVEV